MEDDLIRLIKKHFSLPQLIELYIPEEENDVAQRWGLFPIKDIPAFERYKNALKAFWLATSVSFDDDRIAYASLSDSEKKFLSSVLAIFAFLDGGVADTLLTRFLLEAKTLEERIFFANQLQMEIIHAESYGLQIHAITSDDTERTRLMSAVNHMPFIKRYADYVRKYTSSLLPYRLRMVANAAMEGVGFSGLFAAIFYFKFRPNPVRLKGIFFSNEEIMKDEGMHRDNAVALYLKERLDTQEELNKVLEIVLEMVNVSDQAIDNFMIEDFPTLSRDNLKNYVRFVADTLLVSLGFVRYYKISNPIPWMNTIGTQGKSNFFERQTADYTRSEDVNNVDIEDIEF